MAGELDLRLHIAQRRAGGDADLLAHQVDVADHLGDGMLDLQPGVHFDEREVAVLVEELQGAGIAVAQLAQRRRRRAAQGLALFGGDRGRAGLLQQFLVPPLQAAIAFAEMHHVAMAVRQHLQFDMARPVEIFLDINGIVAKRGARLGARQAERILELGRVARHLHAAPAAPRGRLDQDRIADPVRNRARRFHVRHCTVGARHQRDPQARHRRLGGDLVAHHGNMRRGRADEAHTMRLHHFREAGIFRQEAVAGMDRVGPGDRGRGQDRRDVQIAVLGRRRANADAFIRQPHMHRLGVGGGVHRDRRDPQFTARTLDAQRDFTAIGDQDFMEQGGAYSTIIRTSPYSTGALFCTRMRATVPAFGALI